ncbi:MAG: metallophosphoesterase [Pirellulales bacterium]|nr:metallophosphoesterase [Pirellulales bacterium]
MAERDYQGLLLIGDPHLEGRVPGHRKDEYPRVILDKLAWCLDYARGERLLPIILGDLFDKPRDNPTWMIGELLSLFTGEIIGLYGNHDCADPALCDHDSLSLLVRAGRLRLVDEASPWRGEMNGRSVVVGGSSYRCPLLKQFDPQRNGDAAPPLVVWLAHHDILIPGYDAGRVVPVEIPGVDLVVNGHIHRRLEDIQTGGTLWLTPGNISRRSRSDATCDHTPAVLRIDVSKEAYLCSHIEVPHRPFDEVFHPAVADDAPVDSQSAFVAGLAELQARRTASGAGLIDFLKQNVATLEGDVAAEILSLANEVTAHE